MQEFMATLIKLGKETRTGMKAKKNKLRLYKISYTNSFNVNFVTAICRQCRSKLAEVDLKDFEEAEGQQHTIYSHIPFAIPNISVEPAPATEEAKKKVDSETVRWIELVANTYIK